MPLPSEVTVWSESIDPRDIRPFAFDLSTFLNPGEDVSVYDIVLLAESILAGLELGVGQYAHAKTGNLIIFYPLISVGMQEDLQFYGSGVRLPIVLNITTNSTPPRRLQRTYAVEVKQR